MPANVYVVDLNKSGKAVRGSILLGATTVTTALQWWDLGDPNILFPFNTRLGGPAKFVVSFEPTGTWSGTVQVLGSQLDTGTPLTTPCGASTPNVPILAQWTTPNYFTLQDPFRFLAANVSVYATGTANIFVYGTF